MIELDLTNGALESSVSIPSPGRILVAWTDLAQVVHVTDVRLTPSLELLASRTDRVIGPGRYGVLAGTRLAYRVTGIEGQWDTFVIREGDLEEVELSTDPTIPASVLGWTDYGQGSSGLWPCAITADALAWQGLDTANYLIHRVPSSPSDPIQFGSGQGLARIDTDGSVVTNDENRESMPRLCHNPQFARDLIVGEGRHDPAHVVVDLLVPLFAPRALWPNQSSRTPRCAALGDCFAITSQGKLWAGTAADIVALPLASSVTQDLVVAPYGRKGLFGFFRCSEIELREHGLDANCLLFDLAEGIGEITTRGGIKRVAAFAGGGSFEQTVERIRALAINRLPAIAWCEDEPMRVLELVASGQVQIPALQVWIDRHHPEKSAAQLLTDFAVLWVQWPADQRVILIPRASDGRQKPEDEPFYACDLRALAAGVAEIARDDRVIGVIPFSA